MAVLAGGWSAFQQLLDQGSDVNARDDAGSTPLSLVFNPVAYAPSEEIRTTAQIDQLVAHESKRWQAQAEMVRALLAHGADPNQTSLPGETPLTHLASAVPAAGFDSHDFHKMDREARRALERKADLLILQAARSLIEHGADVDRANAHGVTPLMAAARAERPDFVRLLLEHGADPNVTSGRTPTALMEAMHNGDLNVAEVLVAHGADVNLADVCGTTPLMIAADRDEPAAEDTAVIAFVKFLLAHGADPVRTDCEGKTALDLAQSHEQADVIRLLQANR